MNPEQALQFLTTIARNAVLVAHPGGQQSGLTYDDHARLAQAESVLHAAIAPRESENVQTQEGETDHAET